MAKTISTHANEVQASTLDGPLLTAQQPPNSMTVIIAVVGNYKPETTPAQLLDNSLQHTTFLALLSTETPPKQAHESDDDEQQLQQRKDAEDYLIDVRQSRYCGRYLDLLEQQNSSPRRRLYRNAEHFCATGGKCSHGVAPSTFPGDKNWTFALGEARGFDDDDSPIAQALAPEEESEADRALGVLGEMVRRAVVEAGLGGLKVVISVSDPMEFEPDHDEQGGLVALLERLISRVFDVVIGWVEEGWVGRDSFEVVWRPLGVTRNFGVVGPRETVPFVFYDEEG